MLKRKEKNLQKKKAKEEEEKAKARLREELRALSPRDKPGTSKQMEGVESSEDKDSGLPSYLDLLQTEEEPNTSTHFVRSAVHSETVLETTTEEYTAVPTKMSQLKVTKKLPKKTMMTSHKKSRPGSSSLNYVPTHRDFLEAQAAGDTLPAATKTAKRYRPGHLAPQEI